jgi:hypothetical protein
MGHDTPDYDDVYFSCAECNVKEEGVAAMVQHILQVHPEYTPDEAQLYAEEWANSVIDEAIAHNSWRAEEYRRSGVDPDSVDDDPL